MRLRLGFIHGAVRYSIYYVKTYVVHLDCTVENKNIIIQFLSIKNNKPTQVLSCSTKLIKI